jgi:hypothetical protein
LLEVLLEVSWRHSWTLGQLFPATRLKRKWQTIENSSIGPLSRKLTSDTLISAQSFSPSVHRCAHLQAVHAGLGLMLANIVTRRICHKQILQLTKARERLSVRAEEDTDPSPVWNREYRA